MIDIIKIAIGVVVGLMGFTIVIGWALQFLEWAGKI